MKFIVTLFFSTLSFGLTYGQTLKTYTGSYAGGQATYEYFENTDYERIFNGKFSYTDVKDNVNLSRVHMPSSIEIIGAFKDNLKNGLWIAKEVISSVVPSYGNVKITMTYSGNFSNGKRQGQWTFKQNVVSSKKTDNDNVILNFNNNILVGSIDLPNAKGTLDNKGNFSGTWNIKNDGNEFIAEFKNNVFTKLIKRNISDGEIFFKYENQNITNLFFDSLKITQTPVAINGKRYTSIDCVNHNSYNIENIEYSEDNKFFTEFYEVFSNQVSTLNRTLKTIDLGSSESEILPPLIIVEFNGSTKEEDEQEQAKLIEEERVKTNNEKEQAEKQKQEGERINEEQRLKEIELTKIRELEKTDYGQLQKAIKNKMTSWLSKSDFESAADYKIRIQNQSTEKFKTIVEDIVALEKQKQLEVSTLKCGNYNSETQNFPMTYKGGTIDVSVPKDIAQNFEAAFSKTDQWTDTKTIGTLLPLDVAIVNNKWTVIEAVIFFNNHFNFGFYKADFTRFYKENGNYFFDFEYRPDINNTKTNIKRVKTEDIKNIFSSKEIPKKIFYYEWKSQQTDIQPLTFTMQELNIILPSP